jgi:hypothetical protein
LDAVIDRRVLAFPAGALVAASATDPTTASARTPIQSCRLLIRFSFLLLTRAVQGKRQAGR